MTMKPRKCAECAETFTPGRPQDEYALFCSRPCKVNNENRKSKRGRAGLTELVLAWRAGRGSTPEAKFAFAQLCAMADLYNAEDHAAGRAPAARSVRRRMRRGWTAVDTPTLG